MISGQCHCGAVRYELSRTPDRHAICHCTDCRRHAGAPMVSWAILPAEAMTITRGTPKMYASSEHGRRYFCADCGTGLYYTNETALPGMVDIQSATFDDPEVSAPELQVQVADRIGWMTRLDAMPAFDRYPG